MRILHQLAQTEKTTTYPTITWIRLLAWDIAHIVSVRFSSGCGRHGHLRHTFIKCFAMNDELLKKSGGGKYFDYLLARIRDIRSSKKVYLSDGSGSLCPQHRLCLRLETTHTFFRTGSHPVLSLELLSAILTLLCNPLFEFCAL